METIIQNAQTFLYSFVDYAGVASLLWIVFRDYLWSEDGGDL
jgi:hypothetical protein